MKKTTTIFLMLFILIFNITQALAGDLPESMLSSNEARVFFGELVKAEPFSSDFNTTVKPVKKIKGDVIIGEDTEYTNPEFVGNFSPKKGNVYLFAYLDNANPLYVFSADSYDTKTLKISGIDKNDMWQRFCEYLNSGKFEEAEKQRMESLGITPTDEPTELPPMKNIELEMYGLISICVAVIAFFLWNKFSKNKL